MTIRYELLRAFTVVAVARTFAEAAEQLGVSAPAVSQQMRALEEDLGLSLFERRGRRAVLTVEGAAFLHALQRPLSLIDDAVEAIAQQHAHPRGIVRMAGPAPFCAMWLRPKVVSLLRAYPEIAFRIRFGAASAVTRQLVDGDADLAVLVTAPDHATIEARRIHVEEFTLVASPAYVQRHGTPATAEQLRAHPFVVYDEDAAMLRPWWRATFGPGEPVPDRFVCMVTSLHELASLAREHVGLTVLPTYFVAADLAAGTLVALSPAPTFGAPRAHAPANPIYLGWRRGVVETARFRVVRNALLTGPMTSDRQPTRRARTDRNNR